MTPFLHAKCLYLHGNNRFQPTACQPLAFVRHANILRRNPVTPGTAPRNPVTPLRCISWPDNVTLAIVQVHVSPYTGDGMHDLKAVIYAYDNPETVNVDYRPVAKAGHAQNVSDYCVTWRGRTRRIYYTPKSWDKAAGASVRTMYIKSPEASAGLGRIKVVITTLL